MNPFLQPRISSTASWMDANLHESSPWDDAAALQLDGIFSGPLETYARGTSKPDMIGSPPIPESNLNMQINPSTFIDPIMNYSMVPKHSELQQDIQDPVPIQDESANGRHVESRIFAEHDLAAGSFIQEASSLFLQSFIDAQSSSIAPLWQPYTDASAPIEQSNFQGFGLCRDLENSRDIFVNESSNHGLQQASVYTRSFYENESLVNSQMPSYLTCPRMNLPNNTGISNNQQPSDRDSGKNLSSNVTNDSLNIGTGNTASPIGASKPRARARRGQATDPHSIAERLRREKIAERMKNLQELVPNSNKADKGSMLDEIIEYVKFLQLQVKVLSMSRLGATGAVVPLITDQSQDTMNLGLTSDIDSDLSQENIAFEQEVVKLMESDVTAAMQFLQTKGLCLIPIALASAISARKGSSAAIPLKKLEGASHSVNANTSKSREKLAEQHVLNGCNKIAAREDEGKMSPGSARNLKFQA